MIDRFNERSVKLHFTQDSSADEITALLRIITTILYKLLKTIDTSRRNENAKTILPNYINDVRVYRLAFVINSLWHLDFPADCLE